MRQLMIQCVVGGLIWGLGAASGNAQEVASLLVRIKAVGKEGVGNAEASQAMKELIRKGPSVLPDVLGAVDDASPVALNWLRAAVEAIQDRAVNNGQKVPVDKVEAFLHDTRHSGHARRLAYECLVRVDPTTPDRLLPKMLNDPSSEIRRDAVAVKLDHAKKASFASKADQTKFYQDLLQSARDRDQVDLISEELKKLGVKTDLTAHYGFITRWLLVGPFDNVKGVGFRNIYPPEQGVDVKSRYAGKNNQTVRWQEHVTTKPLGLVDITETHGKLKGAVVFAYAAVSSDLERPVELRAESNNTVRIYLNGKEIYFREDCHLGHRMDQHVGKGILKAGRNEILVKVCQDEQTVPWAQKWSFRLRICDYLGTAVPVTNVTEKVK